MKKGIVGKHKSKVEIQAVAAHNVLEKSKRKFENIGVAVLLKKKIMLDGNIFDEIALDDEVLKLCENTLDKYEYYLISIQVQELQDMPDYKKEKREKLIALIDRLQMKMVYVSPAIYGKVKYGQAKYGGDRDVYEKILFCTRSNIDDALIASSAIRENCIVITNDTRFYEKMENNGYPVMDFNEFIADVKSNL